MTKITYQYSYIKKWLCCFTKFIVFEGQRLTHVQHWPFLTGRWCALRRPSELLQSLWSHGAGWWSTEHHLLLLLCSGVWYWNTDGPEKTYTARVRWWSKMDDTSGDFSPTFLEGQFFMTSCHHHNMEARFPHVKKKNAGHISLFWHIISLFWGTLSLFWHIILLFWDSISLFWDNYLIISRWYLIISR